MPTGPVRQLSARGGKTVVPHLLLLTGAEDVLDAVERVVAAPAGTGRLLLDAAADVINDARGELRDMERVGHGDGVLELVVDGVLVAVERVEGGDLDAGAEGLTRSTSQVR
jgi:hypothetical protein